MLFRDNPGLFAIECELKADVWDTNFITELESLKRDDLDSIVGCRLGMLSENIFQMRHSCELLAYAEDLIDRGHLNELDGAILGSTITRLLRILLLAKNGDELAQNQLEALHKVLFPHKFDYESLVETISVLAHKFNTPVMLAHGRAIIILMGVIAIHVKPVDRTDKRLTLDEFRHKVITLKDDNDLARFAHCSEFEGAWKEGDTLEDLALRIYSNRTNLSIQRLKKSLAQADKWNQQYPDQKSSHYPIDVLNERAKQKGDKDKEFLERFAQVVFRLLADDVPARQITFPRIASELNVGDTKGKGGADALRKKLQACGFKTPNNYIDNLIKAYWETQAKRNRSGKQQQASGFPLGGKRKSKKIDGDSSSWRL